ncbi:hypothetical protein LPJ73_005350, partial [Coemansia sp. RSA 2703]
MPKSQLDLGEAAERSLQVVSLSRQSSFSGAVESAHTKSAELKSHMRIIAATHFLPLCVTVSEETPEEPY